VPSDTFYGFHGGSPSLQAQALANAVYAYAANIDNLGALGDAVAMMVHKHVSFDVQVSISLIFLENF
jgi:nitric oxide dioxygenase